MATFLILHGVEVVATVDEQEELILALAAGSRSREDMVAWLESHTKRLDADSAV